MSDSADLYRIERLTENPITQMQREWEAREDDIGLVNHLFVNIGPIDISFNTDGEEDHAVYCQEVYDDGDPWTMSLEDLYKLTSDLLWLAHTIHAHLNVRDKKDWGTMDARGLV